ncbi:MAG TPA: hypothetical protein GXZ95_00280, partial [Mollicutes bacterium]|nr:hypothetical protein [Mollicutes bacterium]
MNLESKLSVVIYEEESLELLEYYKNIEHGTDPISIIRSTKMEKGIDLNMYFKNHKNINKLIYSPFHGRRINIYHYPDITNEYYYHSWDIGISFDLNAMRYLEDYFTKAKDFEINDVKISELVNLRNIEGLQINYIPYLIENTLFKKPNKTYLIDNIFIFNKHFYPYNNNEYNLKLAIDAVNSYLLSLTRKSKKMFEEIFLSLKSTILFM